MGLSPSIMDYARFDLCRSQPEDKVDPKDLLPKLGPYDIWATAWGYKPIASAHTPDEEKKTLDLWAHEQDKTPWLRFSTNGSRGADPGENTEAVGDADAIYSTGMGLKNLNRVMNNLLAATTHEGEDWQDLTDVYGRALGQWEREMGHVSQIVSGLDSQEKHGGQDGVRFTPVPKARQEAAVKFLNENAFATPAMFLKPDILRRMEPNGALDRIRASQLRVLNGLLSPARLGRLAEGEAIDGASAYRPTDFLADVRKGVFQEIYSADPKVDSVSPESAARLPRVDLDEAQRNLPRK